MGPSVVSRAPLSNRRTLHTLKGSFSTLDDPFMRLEGPSLAQKSEGPGNSENTRCHAIRGQLGISGGPSAPVAKSVPSHAQNNPRYLSFYFSKKKTLI